MQCRVVRASDDRRVSPHIAIPQPRSGLVYLGSVNSATGCLAFPSSISVPLTATTGDTMTILRWTVADSISLPALDARTLGYVGSTSDFVPESSLGGCVTFPSGQLAVAKACKP